MVDVCEQSFFLALSFSIKDDHTHWLSFSSGEVVYKSLTGLKPQIYALAQKGFVPVIGKFF